MDFDPITILRPLAIGVALASVGILFLKNPVYSGSEGKTAARIEPSALRAHVTALAAIPRSFQNESGQKDAVQYIERTLKRYGLKPRRQTFTADGREFVNIIVQFGDERLPRIVIGAHYDSAGELPGADDNASGVAGLLELARLLKNAPPQKRSMELVFYANEEPPYFGTEDMGSFVHAKSLADANVEVEYMLSLEMIGYYSDKPGSQEFPLPALAYIYPDTGNFIALVGRPSEWLLIRKLKAAWKKYSDFPLETLNAPESVPGLALSDHINYWKHGFRALMLTDTAFFRNKNYHEKTDTPETLDYRRMAAVVEAVYGMLVEG